MLQILGLNRAVEIIPNALTIAALCFGLTSIRVASEGHFETAVQCMVTSAVLDGLDGHAARALHATTRLGAELDSLCDLADFGVAPALILFFWGSQFEGSKPDWLLWASCLLFCAVRAGFLAGFI